MNFFCEHCANSWLVTLGLLLVNVLAISGFAWTTLKLRRIARELPINSKIVSSINELRGDEGSVVTIRCDSPDLGVHRNVGIEVVCNGNWWGGMFYGCTLLDALEKAVDAKRRFCEQTPA